MTRIGRYEQRFPSKLSYFLDGLRREFGGRDANENICTLRLESYDMRVDGWIGDFIASLCDNHRRRFRA
jgi:hypothetical protein